MTTTTLFSHSPTHLSFPPQSQTLLSPQQYPMDHVGEKFPSFEDTRLGDKQYPIIQPQDVSPQVSPLSVKNWPARRSSQTGWEKRNGGLHKHRSKRSVSEALDNFRQRRGSLSMNTHELAEALKAPVSYKLIVSPEISADRQKSVLTSARRFVLYGT